MNVAAGALIVGIACLLAALLIGVAGTSSTPADRAPTTPHRARDASEPDVTILGPRADNDAIFGTYPSLRVVDRLSPEPPVSDPEGINE